MRLLRIALLVGGLALAGSLSAAEIPQVAWPAVEGAGGYLVEVRSGQKTLSQTVTQPAFDLPPTPGTYQIRVTTLDRFLKPGARTDWMRFSVVRAVTPTVTAVTPETVPPGESRFVVQGSGFSSSTDVVLMAPEGEIKVLGKQVVSDNKLEFSAALVPGTYTLVLSNPPGQTARLPAGVTVLKPVPDVVRVPEPLPNPDPITPPPTVAVGRPLPLRWGAGYGALVPLGAWSAVVGPSYQDFEVFASWPMWGEIGPFVRIGYSGFDSKTGTGLPSSRLNTEAVAAGASWALSSLPVRLWLAPGVTLTQASTSADQAGSFDLSMSGGAALVLTADHLFWELGSDYRVVFYTGTPLQSVGLVARSGISY